MLLIILIIIYIIIGAFLSLVGICQRVDKSELENNAGLVFLTFLIVMFVWLNGFF